MKKIILLFAISLLGGCSSKQNADQAQKPAAAGQKQPVEFVTGREAFQRMYGAARLWAADAQPIRLESQDRAENKADGKADVWGATFVSPGRRLMKPYLWSGVAADDAPQPGLTPGNEDGYNPDNASTRPFNISALHMDSDAALTEADKHGGKEQLKKDPKSGVKFALTWDPLKSELVWHVVYGRNENTAPLTIFVDATSGKFLHAAK